MADYSSPLVAGPGGVMTDEVGVVTGDLELRTTLVNGVLRAKVRYEGADEWYAVTGASCRIRDPRDHAAVHQVLLGVLNRPLG
ncbi:hypothetical protein FHS29_001080 [Saccharothrix tamanrassetensis]|uniref:Uncharacterized protein n=1 Tax=Saccharothrix tamanrassetensis TaxID=1051531 RepID=A0A841CC09_9PSEU|nr:hypothetical protein [Saccharothrix tamanrassetensis]MBB5954510.1 hypothetical protein [Saccharothrix tamanrassetensis]